MLGAKAPGYQVSDAASDDNSEEDGSEKSKKKGLMIIRQALQGPQTSVRSGGFLIMKKTCRKLKSNVLYYLYIEHNSRSLLIRKT
jgi:hypothetical protein